MTEDEVLAHAGKAYLALIHLEGGAQEAAGVILACEGEVADAVVSGLLVGASWRERLIGLVLACGRGLVPFCDDLLSAMRDLRGISIVPTTAALSVGIADLGYEYSPDQTSTLDRDAFDGEVGFALDHLHHVIGKGEPPAESSGPNYGQVFKDHRAFYAKLCKV